MLDQLNKIIEQFTAQEVSNSSVDNSLTSKVAQETGNSLLEGISGAVKGGNFGEIMNLFNQDKNSLVSNPLVQQIISGLTNNLGTKVGIDSKNASSLAATLIPLVISFLGSKAKSGEAGFNITDIISGLSGGKSGGLLDALGGLGLDKNGDGKVDFQDALAALTGDSKNTKSSGGLGGLLGGLFGKK